jgi:5-methyltetrahydropteroyltriglutamate--homocysteine methyltransferase
MTLRVDNVGSMLRPAELVDAVARHEAGDLSDDGLRAVEDAAVRDLVAEQERHDLPIVVDGEFRRLNFMQSFTDVAGFDTWMDRHRAAREARRLAATEGGVVTAPSALALTPATEPLRLRRSQPLDEFTFAQSLTRRPVKVSLIGPDRVMQRFDHAGSKAVYATVDAFLADVVAIQRRMIRELVDAGCRYVHIDEPGYTAYVDEPSLEAMRKRGEDPMQNFSRSLRANAALVKDFPGVTFGIHLCRGNQRSTWHREGTYDAIAERLFTELPYQRFLLEYDSPRAGSFAPLRFVPKDKVVVLGLVSTKVPELEPVDTLVRRIDEAAKYVPLERLAISPQCGFGSDVVGNLVSEDDQKRKLERVVAAARKVWQ